MLIVRDMELILNNMSKLKDALYLNYNKELGGPCASVTKKRLKFRQGSCIAPLTGPSF